MRTLGQGRLGQSLACALACACVVAGSGACSGASIGAGPGGAADGGRGSGDDAGSDVDVVLPGPPAVAFFGRFDTRDPAGPKASWPGSRIVVRFQGSDLGARLDDAFDDNKPGPSEWDVTIDGALQPKPVLARGPRDYDLAKGLAPGVHVVELYKRSEAQLGVTQLLGIDYHGGSLLAPIAPRARRVEIIGDSAATAFGVDGVGPTCAGANDAAKYENFRASWGAKLGVRFHADVHGTSYSGKGLVKDIWRPDTQVMPLLFPRANPDDDTSAFDLASWIADVVVVMIGGNDFDVGLPVDDGPATLDAFTSAYDRFVGTLRGAYPNAHLFLTTSPTLSDDSPPGRASRSNVHGAIASVVAARSGAGDARVHAFDPAIATPAETTGCDGHGGPAFHDRVAGELATPIRAALGW